jgi:hypothetical protein
LTALTELGNNVFGEGMTLKKKGGNLAAWQMVLKPKDKGGLGVLNLRLHNDSLLMKHLHKWFSKPVVFK